MKTNFLLYAHPDAVLLSFKGGAFTLLLIILSGLNLNSESSVISLAWLPLAAIFLWPRWSHPFLTPVLIAILGLFADLLLGRFLGLSSLVYLIFFWIVKPAEREFQIALFRGWLEFALIVSLLLVSMFYGLGRTLDLVVGWRAIVEQVIVTIAFFPAIFGARALLRKWTIDPDDANYQS